MIALALSCNPSVLIADEPTTALDVTIQAQILQRMRELRDETGAAIILVTHDLGVVAGHTDEIAVMYGGRLVEKAPTKTLFANMKMPYTEALMKSIPRLENPSHSRLLAITGRPPSLINLPQGCRFAPRCPYAQERCREEEPPLRDAETPGHQYRCWFPVGTPEGQAALERNLRAGETAIGTAIDPSVAEVEEVGA
jgi:peptide/nickel transport system ATP-binding protein